MTLCLAILSATRPLSAQQNGVSEPRQTSAILPEAAHALSGGVPQTDEEPNVKVREAKTLTKPDVSARLKAKLGQGNKKDEDLKALAGDLEKKGYRAAAKLENHFGSETTYERADKQTAKVTLLLQDYTKAGSKDQAAVGTITIATGERASTYAFSVVAPNGKFEDVVEQRVDEKTLRVVRANSLWSCFVARVKSKCVGTCIAALGTCSGSWAAYLGCLAVACGGCAAKAFGCCLCDCSWWCKWAVGCCDR
jgi:hypothetical protein